MLDTNAVAEFQKPRPHAGFMEWLGNVDEGNLYLSVATFAEMRAGVDGMPRGARQRKLADWVAGDLLRRFDVRVVHVDLLIADEWGRITAARRTKGRAIAAVDALIAATANVLGMTLVVRNTRDFEGAVTNQLNPWVVT